MSEYRNHLKALKAEYQKAGGKFITDTVVLAAAYEEPTPDGFRIFLRKRYSTKNRMTSAARLYTKRGYTVSASEGPYMEKIHPALVRTQAFWELEVYKHVRLRSLKRFIKKYGR